MSIASLSRMTPVIRLGLMLEPGELQGANNDAVLHSRTAFRDHEAPELRR